jgi:hypothetical protein
VGGRADTGVAFSVQTSMRTLRAAGGHPRGFLGSMLRSHLPQLSPTCVLKRALSSRAGLQKLCKVRSRFSAVELQTLLALSSPRIPVFLPRSSPSSARKG